ncbi:hypothetical protein B484DRAFT_401081 [Ochromonadaceae sp. CCMP2298]|nr:hypothetical protein B484DRAFT_401081 [Ochromonadaceae sp. CCMP2298]
MSSRHYPQHFVGMSSLKLYHQNGEVAEVRYNLSLSLASLMLTLLFVALGMYICSLDRVFTMTRKELVEDFVAGAKNLTIRQVQQKSVLRMLYIIGSKELHYLAMGGFTTSAGVVLAHYTGFAGIEFDGHIRWNIGMIAASILIAFVALAAFAMSDAVICTHYVGMMAARFVEGEASSSRHAYGISHMHANLQFQIGVGFAVCVAVLTVMIPLADLRYSVQRLCYELSRADDLILSLPLPEQSVSYARVKRYVEQCKACSFNTNVIIAHERGTSVIRESENSDDEHSEDEEHSVRE